MATLILVQSALLPDLIFSLKGEDYLTVFRKTNSASVSISRALMNMKNEKVIPENLVIFYFFDRGYP